MAIGPSRSATIPPFTNMTTASCCKYQEAWIYGTYYPHGIEMPVPSSVFTICFFAGSIQLWRSHYTIALCQSLYSTLATMHNLGWQKLALNESLGVCGIINPFRIAFWAVFLFLWEDVVIQASKQAYYCGFASPIFDSSRIYPTSFYLVLMRGKRIAMDFFSPPSDFHFWGVLESLSGHQITYIFIHGRSFFLGPH